jgi:hypothetical protein
MVASSDGMRENLVLTTADLATCKPIAGEGGHVLRALCPFHGSDHQRSLRVTVATGRFVCFACGAWGYMDTARAQWREEQQRQAALGRPPAHRQRLPHRRQPPPRLPRPPAARKLATDPPAPHEPAPARADLAQQLAAFQAALPGSRGDTYLQQRGIPLALAQQLGVGYAALGTWPHPARDWRGGRVVFPHTTPDGRLVNLYGRAVGTAEQVPKAKRHDHLPGVKGYFDAAALQAGPGPLWVCEGVFDALALLAAGVSRVVAIFGGIHVKRDNRQSIAYSEELIFSNFSHPSEHGPTPWDCGPRVLSFSTRFVNTANRASGAWRIAPGFPKAAYIAPSRPWIAGPATRSRRCGKRQPAAPG